MKNLHKLPIDLACSLAVAFLILGVPLTFTPKVLLSIILGTVLVNQFLRS